MPDLTRRSVFGLIAAPAVVPDSCLIARPKFDGYRLVHSHYERVFGRNINPWMFIYEGKDRLDGEPFWSLTHRESRLAIGTFATREKALTAAATILPLCDWSQIHNSEDAKSLPATVKAAIRLALREDRYA